MPGHVFDGGDMVRKLLASVLLVTLLLPTPQASSLTWRRETCRYQTWDGHKGFSNAEVKKTIRCAVRHWPVEGGVKKALAIAARESKFDEFADNPYSSAAGVYQFVSGTWDGIHDSIHPWWHRWELHHSVYNARANCLAAVKWAHRHGWGAWGG